MDKEWEDGLRMVIGEEVGIRNKGWGRKRGARWRLRVGG